MAEEDQEKTAFVTSQGLYYHPGHAIRIEERRSYILETSKPDVQETDWEEC